MSTFPPLTSNRLVSYSLDFTIVIEGKKGTATSSDVCVCVRMHAGVCKTVYRILIYDTQYLNFINLKNMRECHP